MAVLTPEDWYLLGFYRRVADQWTNAAPMGTEKGAPPVLTANLPGYEAALRLYGYDPEDWPWLVDGAQMLHRIAHGIDGRGALRRDCWRLLRRHFDTLTPEDVSDGD